MQKTSSKYKYLILFNIPAVAFYAVFVLYPLFGTFILSLFNTEKFVGLANFNFLFNDQVTSERFWNGLLNSTEYFFISAAVQLPIGLLLAALLTSGAVRRLTGFYRTAIFIPATLSVVIVGFIWSLIISPLWGIVSFPLLGNKLTALPTLSLMWSWSSVGIPMIFLYSALLAIPTDILEAARVDGASGMRVFWQIKLPIIYPQLGLLTILTFIWSFNMFDQIYAVAGGAPGPDFSTDVLGTMFYRTFFGWRAQVGDPNLGAATATVIFFIMAAITASYFFIVQRRLKISEL
jgi:raffinose/stachyose/melibiose transport system permease protein